MRTLLIDNYDSFTYNLYQYLGEVNGCAPVVVRNDARWEDLPLDAVDNVVISPGPGHPGRRRDLGISARVIRESQLPILGICLGHQALAYLAGGEVAHAPMPVHGRRWAVHHVGEDLFQELPSPFTAVRYHSLCVTTLPAEFERLAWTEDGVVMALRHRTAPRWGVQFHPESIATEHGRQLLARFRDLTAARLPTPRRSRPTPASTRRSSPPPRAVPPRWQVLVRKVPFLPDAEAAHGLFDPRRHAFWLDSSLVADGRSRFSFLGDGGGPYAEIVQY